MVERERTATVDLKVRMKEALRSQIEVAARQAGISLNAEAVSRLEQSFDRRPLLAAMELAFGKELGGIVIVLGEAMARTRDLRLPADGDYGEPWVYNEMVRAACLVLEAFRPEGEIVFPTHSPTPTRGPGAKGRRLTTLGRKIEDLSAGEYVARLRLLGIVEDRLAADDPATPLLGEALVALVKERIG